MKIFTSIMVFAFFTHDLNAQIQEYLYDHSGRLIKTAYNRQRVMSFIYDNDGNRTSRNVSDNPSLQITIGLQGDMQSSGIMRNDLQNYFGGNSGLIPLGDPYGSSQTYTQINNPSGPAGAVVDWVKVTVRSAITPSTIHQSRALLLKPNGTIVDTTGNFPRFDPQNSAVRISISCRNHLSILSNSISSFGQNATVSYNFTTALSQASNDYADPAQMVQMGGKWCMWAGDVNSVPDLFVDNVDFLLTRTAYQQTPFDVYYVTDLNMDGTVDNADFLIQRLNYQLGVYSSLSNY